jgi:uncharacterized protein (DUF488 family)
MKLYTIGYGGRTPQDMISILVTKGVRAVVDVRLRPDRASMGIYVKAKSPDKGIEKLLTDAEIEYFPRPELGNVFRDFDDWVERYRELLHRAGELLTGRLGGIPEPYCLLCAERRVAECHRQAIADFLVSRGHEVEHLE